MHWRGNPDATYQSWFLWPERLKNFRSIRRGIQQVIAEIEENTFGTAYRGSSLETVVKSIAEQRQIFEGADHPFLWEPTELSFSESIRSRRCLIHADGFYEWKKSGKVRQPYCFEFGKGDLFAFAGLWDEWQNPEGRMIKSCTVLTTTPNTLLADIHDRMPVIVTPDKYDLWLNPDVEDFDAVREILKPYDPSLMRHYPVSPRVNSAQNDEAERAAPITLELPAQAQLF